MITDFFLFIRFFIYIIIFFVYSFKAIIIITQVDVVLSDMAPNVTGTKTLDHDLILALAYSALRFAVHHSRHTATFLCKVRSLMNYFTFTIDSLS